MIPVSRGICKDEINESKVLTRALLYLISISKIIRICVKMLLANNNAPTNSNFMICMWRLCEESYLKEIERM